jgi:hypothetical protein
VIITGSLVIGTVAIICGVDGKNTRVVGVIDGVSVFVCVAVGVAVSV